MQAVVRAHLWLKQLQDGTHRSIEDLGRAVKVHPKNVRIGLRLAFLAPKIIKHIFQSKVMRADNIAAVMQLAGTPMWKEQFAGLQFSDS